MPFIKLKSTGDEAVARIVGHLRSNGLRVMMSFDSGQTRIPASRVACPHHGSAACDCRIIIFLVYDIDGEPATLITHGQDGETWISLVAAPQQRPDASLDSKIKEALSALSLWEATGS